MTITRIDPAKRLLAEAVSQITTDTPTASAIKSKMLALDPTFDENRYGYSNFREFFGQGGRREDRR